MFVSRKRSGERAYLFVVFIFECGDVIKFVIIFICEFDEIFDEY